MDEFLKMDVFFVVATIGIVVVAGLVAAVLVYALRLVRTLERIAEDVEEEAKALRADLQEARSAAKREGKEFKKLADFAIVAGKRLLKRRK